MSLKKDIPMTAAVHAAVWALPLSTGGYHNVLSVLVWAYALLMLLGVYGAWTGVRAKTRQPALMRWIVRASAMAAITWLIYHGYMVLGCLMLFSAVMILLGRYADKQSA